MPLDSMESRFSLTGKTFSFAILASAVALTLTTGCSTKNYVRTQTGPLIQQTNDLDAKTATVTFDPDKADAAALIKAATTSARFRPYVCRGVGGRRPNPRAKIARPNAPTSVRLCAASASSARLPAHSPPTSSTSVMPRLRAALAHSRRSRSPGALS